MTLAEPSDPFYKHERVQPSRALNALFPDKPSPALSANILRYVHIPFSRVFQTALCTLKDIQFTGLFLFGLIQ